MSRRDLGGHLLVLAVFLLVAAAWSWPAPLLDPQQLPGRHFDLYPALWLVDRAPDIGLDLHHAESAWPEGETLARLDSWVLLALGWLLRPLLSATSILCLLAWWGPALTAFAAERCAALAFGVRRPWSLVAGLCFGFSGVAASAALEGHLPHLLEPGLPLLLGAGLLASGRGGRGLHGLLAGLGASLALLTTAYHGLSACLLLLVLGLRAVRTGRAAIGRILLAGVVLLPVGGWLAWAYAAGSGEAVSPRRVLELAQLGSAPVAALLTWTPAQDVVGHSVGAPTSGLVLAALLLGWRDPARRWLLVVAGLGLLLAMGPVLRLSAEGAGLTSPLAWLWHTPAGAVLRFPVRFAWLTALCGGVAASWMLDAATGPRAWPGRAAAVRAGLLLLALADVFVVTGMPARQQARPLPPAAGEGAGAVLDLYSVAAWPEQSDVEMWARTTSCARQLSHGRPVLERCIGTSVASPRDRVAAWLLPRVMATRGPPADLATRLAGLGIGSVVVHRDWFRPQDLPVLEAGLAASLGAGREGPGGLVRFEVAGPLADRQAAADALRRIQAGRR